MAKTTDRIEVCIEAGKKKTFASAVDWPGWSRSGKDEEAALRALADYGQRYARVAKAAKVDYQALEGPLDFAIVERLEGSGSTDFGVPEQPAAADARPVDEKELARLQALLSACYKELDRAAKAAQDRALRKGPRGGGRELDEILRHVTEAEDGYVSRVGWKIARVEGERPEQQTARWRQAVLDALAAAARGETEPAGPRGGKRWSPRYLARREAWHVLDHAWEIEDRAD